MFSSFFFFCSILLSFGWGFDLCGVRILDDDDGLFSVFLILVLEFGVWVNFALGLCS